MNYLQIVALTFAIIWGLFFIMLLPFTFFSFIGIFVKKRFTETDIKGRYAILISARNEEKVIEGLIESIRENDYPQDKVDIFICAHNCTDKTAELARNKGAIVYEYSNPNERTLGYAYRYTLRRIKEEHNLESYDGVLIINADNRLSKNYLTKLNDAYMSENKEKVFVSYRNSTNFGSNYMSILYGMFFIAACRFEARGRTFFGCSTRVSGTGYVYNPKLIKDGWNYVTLTEDWEFTADQISEGNKIYYCDDAIFYDEQPTTIPVMWRQRLRWARGHTIVFFTRFKKLMKSLFRSRKKGGPSNKVSILDISICILPNGVIGVSIAILQLILIAIAPLFGMDAAYAWATYGIYWAIATGAGYVMTCLSAVLLLILEHRRIPKLGFWKTLAAILVWPLFLGLAIIQDVISLFVKNLEWKPIPHTGKDEK